jgi:hypothetical protein
MKTKILALLLMALLTTSCGKTPFATITIDPNNLPKFIKHDFVDLSKIKRISKFRSGVGHDFSDDFESNRSMKHYYAPYDQYLNTDSSLEVYSPVNGKIVQLFKSETNRPRDWEVRIRPEDYPALLIIIFHINVDPSLKVGDRVSEGQKLGFANLLSISEETKADNFDIAVQTFVWGGRKLVSYFEIMTDELFESYKNRGISSRDQFIISKEYRDAHPIDWGKGEISAEDWVFLN